jgi:hypothetical protein
MTGLPPSSRAMPNWTASMKTLGDNDDDRNNQKAENNCKTLKPN